jgi:hypothetical protein
VVCVCVWGGGVRWGRFEGVEAAPGMPRPAARLPSRTARAGSLAWLPPAGGRPPACRRRVADEAAIRARLEADAAARFDAGQYGFFGDAGSEGGLEDGADSSVAPPGGIERPRQAHSPGESPAQLPRTPRSHKGGASKQAPHLTPPALPPAPQVGRRCAGPRQGQLPRGVGLGLAPRRPGPPLGRRLCRRRPARVPGAWPGRRAVGRLQPGQCHRPFWELPGRPAPGHGVLSPLPGPLPPGAGRPASLAGLAGPPAGTNTNNHRRARALYFRLYSLDPSPHATHCGQGLCVVGSIQLFSFLGSLLVCRCRVVVCVLPRAAAAPLPGAPLWSRR